MVHTTVNEGIDTLDNWHTSSSGDKRDSKDNHYKDWLNDMRVFFYEEADYGNDYDWTGSGSGVDVTTTFPGSPSKGVGFQRKNTNAISEELRLYFYDGAWKFILIGDKAMFSVSMHLDNLIASQDFILVDVSDTTNWPHANGSGKVNIHSISIFLDPDNTFNGDITLIFIEENDSTDGTTHELYGVHLQKQAVEQEISKIFQTPLVADKIKHLSDTINTTDTGVQDDVALASVFDKTVAYSTLPEDDDVLLRLDMSAGSIDIGITIQYTIQ